MTTGESVAEFERAARVTDIPPGGLLGVATPSGRHVCLADVDGEVVAMIDNCSHQAFPLSEGTLLPGGCLECAWHGARFDCHTGDAVHGPAVDPIVRLAVEVRDGEIYVGGPLP